MTVCKSVFLNVMTIDVRIYTYNERFYDKENKSEINTIELYI